MQLIPATTADAACLADILFTAFADDKLIVGTCYPDTPANRAWWARNIASQMSDPHTKVFKVVADDGPIIAWAKWLVQRNKDDAPAEGAVNPSNEPSPDMNLEACMKLAGAQYKMREAVMQGRDHYWLNALATHPAYQSQGAATALVALGTKLADEEGVECFSACTTQANANMKHVFKRAGFSVVAEEPVANGLNVHAGYRAASLGCESVDVDMT